MFIEYTANSKTAFQKLMISRQDAVLQTTPPLSVDEWLKNTLLKFTNLENKYLSTLSLCMLIILINQQYHVICHVTCMARSLKI